MNSKFLPLLIMIMSFSCHKSKDRDQSRCDMEKILKENETRATISNGVWGTVIWQEGNCMPVVDGNSTCKTCPAKRVIRIYEQTMRSQAKPADATVLFTNFDTRLIKEIQSDESGFFQTALAAGDYSIVLVENGQLYAPMRDDKGALNGIKVTGGKQKINLMITYKAVY